MDAAGEAASVVLLGDRLRQARAHPFYEFLQTPKPADVSFAMSGSSMDAAGEAASVVLLGDCLGQARAHPAII